MFTIISLALLIRILIACIFPGAEYDINSYRIIGSLFLNGQNPYKVAPERYPYFPGWMFIEAAIVLFWKITGLPFSLLVRMPQILADTGICVILYYIVSQGFVDIDVPPYTVGLIHALNPVSIAVIAGHGQFDSIPFLCLLIAGIFLYQERLMLSAFVLGVGITIKTPALLFGLLFLSYCRNVHTAGRYITMAAFPTIALSAGFIIDAPMAFFSAVFGYQSGAHISWYQALLLLSSIDPTVYALFDAHRDIALSISKRLIVLPSIVLVSLVYHRYQRQQRMSLWSGMLILSFVFFVTSVGLAPQYLYWFTPFLWLSPLSPTLRRIVTITGLSVLIFLYASWYWLYMLPVKIAMVPVPTVTRAGLLISIVSFLLIVGVAIISLLQDARLSEERT